MQSNLDMVSIWIFLPVDCFFSKNNEELGKRQKITFFRDETCWVYV